MNNMMLKHIHDLEIGDEIIINIPTVCEYIGKVSFINKENGFIFLDEDEDCQESIKFVPDKNGYFQVKQ